MRLGEHWFGGGGEDRARGAGAPRAEHLRAAYLPFLAVPGRFVLYCMMFGVVFGKKKTGNEHLGRFYHRIRISDKHLSENCLRADPPPCIKRL